MPPLLDGTASVAPSTNFALTIGGGGARNVSGVNSTGFSLTATGGGRGGAYSATAPSIGGSGGGGAGLTQTTGAAGTSCNEVPVKVSVYPAPPEPPAPMGAV